MFRDGTDDHRGNGLTNIDGPRPGRPRPGILISIIGVDMSSGPSRRGKFPGKALIILVVAVVLIIVLAALLGSGLLRSSTDEGSDDEGLGPVTLSSPAAGAVLVGFPNVLSWDEKPSAVGYELLISEQQSLEDALVDATLGDTSYSFNVEEGTFFWKVSAIGPGGLTGDSEIRSFKVVRALAVPVFEGTNGEELGMVINGSIVLHWTAVNDALFYDVQVSNDTEFRDIVFNGQSSSPQIELGSLEGRHTYYARVNAENTYTQSAWSAVYSFKIMIAADGVPTTLGPVHGKTVATSDVTFNWTSVPGAISYHLEADDDQSFSSPEVDRNISASSCVCSGLFVDNTTYYWRVSAKDPFSEGNWSATASFMKGYEFFLRTYSWTYDGLVFSMDLNVTGSTYYEEKELNSDLTTRRASSYISHVDSADEDVREAASAIKYLATSKSYGAEDTLNLAMAFVQSIRYGYDVNTTGQSEYVRHPAETLVDGTGDCDCKSVLLLSLIQTMELGYDGVLLFFGGDPGHMAVGVAGPFTGTDYDHLGVGYFYCETTSVGWTVGKVPPEVSARWATAVIIDA